MKTDVISWRDTARARIIIETIASQWERVVLSAEDDLVEGFRSLLATANAEVQTASVRVLIGILRAHGACRNTRGDPESLRTARIAAAAADAAGGSQLADRKRAFRRNACGS